MKSTGTIVVLAALSATAAAQEIDFDNEIVPLLSKAGCNAAACHGSAAGQAGFRLSLFGGDPAFDHRTIVKELEGRRVRFVRPRESLVIAKPTGQLDHGGGEVLDLDGEAVGKLEAWIAAGARRLRKRMLKELRVTPKLSVGDSVPLEIPIRVEALFSDGTKRDVTKVAVYSTRDESALTVSADGRMRVTRPGRQSAIVRFGGQVRTVLVTTPIGSAEIPASNYPASNWIDDEITEVLRTLRLAAAPAADDASFLRRATLDLTGRLPAVSRVKNFVEDGSEAKRSELIDRLLASDEFTEYWTHQLAGLLRIRVPATDQLAAGAFYDWVHRHVEQGSGWDRLVTELLLSEGDTHTQGAATFHRLFATPREQAEYVSEVFLGVRLRCANCHNHPLDRWTQDDYHGLAQIFAGVQRGKVVTVSDRGEVTHPRTGEVAIARIPGVDFIEDAGDKRVALADWLTQDNHLFAQAMAGRIWEALMGRGLVTPVDDLRATNPATHPQLLKRLGNYFAEHGYRIRPLIRLICHSAAYGRRSQSLVDQQPDERFYSHAIEKPLSAEVLADAISDVTGIGSQYVSEAEMSRAITVVDRSKTSAELQFLGQCLPGEACSASVTGGRGIASKLHLMNGALLNRKITDPRGRLADLLSWASTDEIVGEFFLRALSRPPTEQELATWRKRIDAGQDGPGERDERCEDFLWALLNCHEFTTNH